MLLIILIIKTDITLELPEQNLGTIMSIKDKFPARIQACIHMKP